ncbi:hypothetical protein [Sulfitobacter aestuariivivens]|uniref:hypothetical protein n=1 Tax=Sulfitobacter aestuariivivens TaxID=2766981 RepID=UPI001FE35859|nr:hypothetical protein [Sulfitobacter aestuariivivens]
MIPRVFLVLAASAALSACQPAVPDSGAGVGFDDNFARQQAQRDAALAASVPPPPPVTTDPLTTPIDTSVDASTAATIAETQRVLAATDPNRTAVPTPPASTVAAVTPAATTAATAPAVLNSDGISQENNFDAVSAQRGIQSDAQRLAAARAQYQVVQPEALPNRGATGPNIVAFALSSNHPIGTKVYSRFGFGGQSKYTRACNRYNSADQAQIDFLARGGPERDRAGVDPDGDGYACAWDPTPFRNARSAAEPAAVAVDPLAISDEG